MQYVRICGSLPDGKPNGGYLVPADEDIFHHVKDTTKPYFVSTFRYNEAHYKHFKANRTIAGITDVTTTKLWWDFDSKEDLERARRDAVALCAHLISSGVFADQLQISFSGSKGFGVEMDTDKEMTPEEVSNICLGMAKDLGIEVDKSMYNAARVFRVPGTRHPDTGLYKFPLTVGQLSDLTIKDIKELAKDIDNTTVSREDWTQVALPEAIYNKRLVKKESPKLTVVTEDTPDLDFTQKTKGFTNCKYALLNGYFDQGNRSNAMMALGATCKALGYPKEITYNLLKGAARLQAQRNNSDPFPKDEIWNNVIAQIYSPHWKGAQYSCKTQPWLKDICDSLGHNKCRHESESSFYKSEEVFEIFKNYAKNIDNNTIKFGIKSLDNKLRVTTSQMMGILGAPASGKTSLALNILNNTSVQGLPSLFLSLDMAAPIMYQKLVHKVTGRASSDIYNRFKDDRMAAEINALVADQFKNVTFSFKSGYTIDMIRQSIIEYQERTSQKLKMLLIDYAECLNGPYSDSTANSAYNANALKDLTNDLDLCTILLVQPQKTAGDASVPLLSMRNVKGSSMLEQAFSILLGIYREGFNPKTPEDDRFMTINCLKNRMGNLFSTDFSWDGLKGTISEISEEEQIELELLRKRKAEMAASDSDGW